MHFYLSCHDCATHGHSVLNYFQKSFSEILINFYLCDKTFLLTHSIAFVISAFKSHKEVICGTNCLKFRTINARQDPLESLSNKVLSM